MGHKNKHAKLHTNGEDAIQDATPAQPGLMTAAQAASVDAADTHSADTANPHATDLGNLAAGTIAELNALISDLIAIYGGVRDIGVGTVAQRPAASTVNRFFWATDEQQLYFDNGATWDTLTVASAFILQGDWNASTNTPDISVETTPGYAWRVSVAGSTDLGGITTWGVGDLAVRTASGWLRVNNEDISAVWGNISGTLSNQTDLQSALDAKAAAAHAAQHTNGVDDIQSATNAQKGLATAAQITSLEANNLHRTNMNNPHSTDLGNMDPGTLTELNALISDLIATYGGVRDIGVGTLAQRPVFGTANRFWYSTDEQNLYRDTGAAWEALQVAPDLHAATHTDGTDDIQNATNAQKGLATAAQITNLESNTSHRTNTANPHATDLGNLSSGTLLELNTLITDLIATYGGVRDIGIGTLAQRPVFGTANRFFYTTDEQNLYHDTGAAWVALTVPPDPHAATHTNGTDDIQSATNAQKGLATAAQITNLEANTAHRGSTANPHATDLGNLGGGTLLELNTLISDLIPTYGGVRDIGVGTLVQRPVFGNINTFFYTTDEQSLYRDTGTAWEALSMPPDAHAASHTNGTDDIQSATNAQKGLATAAQITDLEANTAHRGNTANPHATDLGNLNGGTLAELNTLVNDLTATYGGIRDIGIGTLAQRPVFGTANRFFYTTDEQNLYRDTGTAWEALQVEPDPHAATHLQGGTDAIQDATAAQDGLMTQEYAGKLDTVEQRVNHTGVQPTSTVEFSAAHSHVNNMDDVIDHIWSAGTQTDGFALTDNLDGTIDVAAGSAVLRTIDAQDGPLVGYAVGSVAALALTDLATNYIMVDYNAGSPQIIATADFANDVIGTRLKSILYAVNRIGSVLHIMDLRGTTTDYIRKNAIKDYLTNGIEHANGSVVADAGARAFSVTAGIYHVLSKQFTIPAIDTSVAGTFEYVYRNGIGGWTRVAAQTTIDNLYYDDGSGTLALVDNNKYVNHFVYGVINTPGHYNVVYGTEQFISLAAAQAALIPGDLPSDLNGFSTAVLIAKVIIQKSAVVFADIQSPFETFLRSAIAATHNGLAGLQGGVAQEYYHLTAARHADLTDGGTSVLHTHDASILPAARVAGSTYFSVQHMQDVFHSTGQTSEGGITDDLDGTITVAAGTGLIRATNSDVAELLFTDWAAESGANVALIDNDLNYIYVEWNAGAPRVITTTTKRNDWNTNIFLGSVYRIGTDLHITQESRIKVNDHAALMIRRLLDTMPFAWASGSALSESGVRNVAISSGKFWHGLTPYTPGSFDSSGVDTFTYYYRNGVGGWTEVTGQTQINNTQYDDGDGTLGTLNNNQYGVHWVYRGIDGDVYVIYGQGSYTLVDAEASLAPASLPPHMEEHARIIGRIIILKSAATFTDVRSAFNSTFAAGLPTDHGDLIGLADDDHTQYVLTDGTRDGTTVDRITGEAATLTPTGTTQDIDWANGALQTLDLGSATGNVTLTFSNAVAGEKYVLRIIQGATPRNVILPATVKMPGGTAPNTLTITATDNAVDRLTLDSYTSEILGTLTQNHG